MEGGEDEYGPVNIWVRGTLEMPLGLGFEFWVSFEGAWVVDETGAHDEVGGGEGCEVDGEV